MKAKSIQGSSPQQIQSALHQCIQENYKPTLAFIFLTELEDIDAVTAMFDKAGISIFGASTSEKFTEQGAEPDGIVVLLLDINTADFKIVLKDYKDDSVYDSAGQIGELGKSSFNHPAFIISGADYTIPGELVIKGILDKSGTNVTIIGGMAGEAVNFTGTVFTNVGKTDSGIISLVLNEEKIDVKGIAVSGWKTVGTEKRITKSEGPWIYTIDDEPAMNVIKKFLGSKTAAGEHSKEIIPLDISFPLQVQRQSGKPMMLPFLLWNTTNDAVMVGGPIIEGALFRFSLPPDLEVIDTVIESSRTIQQNELPDADCMLIFSCIGRLSSLGPMAGSEVDGLAATWNKPMAGFYSLGEFGKVDDSPAQFHGTTVSWVALKEKNNSI
jgi:hypothetical protein